MILLFLSTGCAPPPPPPPVRVQVITTESPLPAQLPAGWVARTYTSSAGIRPRLASLWTGSDPGSHGVRAPASHTVAIPTLAASVPSSVEILTPISPLHLGETWDFRDSPTPQLSWIHTDRLTRTDIDPSADYTLLLSLVPGGEVRWIGADWPARTTPVSMVDLGHTLGRLLGIPTLAGADLQTDAPASPPVPDYLPLLATGVPVEPTGPVFEWPTRSARRHQRSPLDCDPFGQPRPQSHPTDLHNLLRIDAALERGELTEAEERLRAIESRHGVSPASIELHARILDRRGHPTEATDLLIARYHTSPSATFALALGDRLFSQHRYHQAINWYNITLTHWSDQPDALLGLARSKRRLGLSVGDLSLLAVISSPHHSWAQLEAQLEAGEAGDLTRAQEVQRAFPEDPDARLLHARALWSVGQWADAEAQLNQLIHQQPRQIDPRIVRARWAIETANSSLALRLLSPLQRALPHEKEIDRLRRAALESQQEARAREKALRREWRHRR